MRRMGLAFFMSILVLGQLCAAPVTAQSQAGSAPAGVQAPHLPAAAKKQLHKGVDKSAAAQAAGKAVAEKANRLSNARTAPGRHDAHSSPSSQSPAAQAAGKGAGGTIKGVKAAPHTGTAPAALGARLPAHTAGGKAVQNAIDPRSRVLRDAGKIKGTKSAEAVKQLKAAEAAKEAQRMRLGSRGTQAGGLGAHLPGRPTDPVTTHSSGGFDSHLPKKNTQRGGLPDTRTKVSDLGPAWHPVPRQGQPGDHTTVTRDENGANHKMDSHSNADGSRRSWTEEISYPSGSPVSSTVVTTRFVATSCHGAFNCEGTFHQTVTETLSDGKIKTYNLAVSDTSEHGGRGYITKDDESDNVTTLTAGGDDNPNGGGNDNPNEGKSADPATSTLGWDPSKRHDQVGNIPVHKPPQIKDPSRDRMDAAREAIDHEAAINQRTDTTCEGCDKFKARKGTGDTSGTGHSRDSTGTVDPPRGTNP